MFYNIACAYSARLFILVQMAVSLFLVKGSPVFVKIPLAFNRSTTLSMSCGVLVLIIAQKNADAKYPHYRVSKK